jgi:hypothetical protein
MRRNVILAVVAIAALALAGMGGLFADFSDIEISEDNYFQTGSLDLAVSNYLGVHYNGDNIPIMWEVSDAWPCCDKSVFFDLENVGQGFQVEPWLYVHFKNFDCYWVQPKDYSTIWVDENGEIVDEPANAPGPGEPQGDLPDFPKPLTEPEYVAELGGIAGEDEDGNPVEVPGIGLCYGETCELPEHIGVIYIAIAGPYPDDEKPATSAEVPGADWEVLDLSAYDANDDGVIKLNELECQEVELCQVPCNAGIWVHISLHFQDFDEEDAYAQDLIPTTYFDEDYPEAKWDHWPTNAIQKDLVQFDIAFELLQNRLP